MPSPTLSIGSSDLPFKMVHTLVIGSGAAGLATAASLKAAGIDDLLIVTEGLQMGTSINTGSDKQTYYKLSLCGDDADSPMAMADTYFSGGGMHGDLALVEASQSARAFLNLVNLGVPFPRDRFGQFIGYKTDHDPRRRATSIGPYTSREMCRALIRRIQELDVPVQEGSTVVSLLTDGDDSSKRVLGAVVVTTEGSLEIIGAENVVLAVGGPGGLYKTSVYPAVHTGAIGLGLAAGARAQNLPESQFGLASIKFRWNVSGTFMQVIPRIVSTDADGRSNPREFLRDYFDSVGQMCSMVFLKGYQWPFDSRKVLGGSSLIDILVYIETVQRGRRVWLDFRENPEDFAFDDLDGEAHEYLANSEATFGRPIERLAKMNPGAIQLYADHDIDITTEPLEIAVCAQHNNGGLAADHWWQSVDLAHLFPVGEVNGSHGVYRPGGSAQNSGQVGAIRAAEYIAARCKDWTTTQNQVEAAAKAEVERLQAFLGKCDEASTTWQEQRNEFQSRMSRAGAHIRQPELLAEALQEAQTQWQAMETEGCRYEPENLAEALRNRYLCLAHLFYLSAVKFAVESGTGSRGSAMVLGEQGEPIHSKLDPSWRILPENTTYREQVQETACQEGEPINTWTTRREIPKEDPWFETAWAKFREGEIYD